MIPAIEVRTRSVDDTRKAGEALADVLSPGDVVSLTGDLGAGKTSLVQGAAKALGVQEPVVSPTFVLVREYRTDVAVRHLDVYRLERIQEVLDLGFEDLLDPDGILFVEWGDRIDGLFPDSVLEVEITGDGEDRTLVFRGRGSRWAGRWERLEGALSPWRPA